MFNLKRFRQWLDVKPQIEDEGMWADQYTDPALRAEILRAYQARYAPITNPWTDPLLYDPLNPPQGWRYDPHNETWIRL
jgi:hypothetical protein